MKPSPRRYLWWGLSLGVLLCLLAAAGLYLSGYHLMHVAHLAPLPAEAPGAKKPLCYVSPKDPHFIRFAPGKDEQGNELVPVYPTAGAPVAPAAREEAKKQYWTCPMHPDVVRDAAGKCPKCGMDLVPLREERLPAAAAAPKERKIKYWVSPMDPGYVRDKPGKAPCGMDLVPVYETEGEVAAAEGTIAVDPNTLQSMGVRTAKAEVRPLNRTIRAAGIINYDEKKLAVVTTKINGWVDRLYPKATGEPIRKGQPLISIYSPELVSAQREYLLALKNLKALEKSTYPEVKEAAQRLVEASRRRLEYWDIPRGQIQNLEKTGEVKKDLTLSSPANGIVIKRNVTQGQMVTAGMPLLEVADLSTVWVDAQIYEYELPWVKIGQSAEMTLAYLPGETFRGKVEYIYPYLSGATRTAKVRLALPNPGLKLKPEMYGQVVIQSPMDQPVVAVPTEAVLDSGEKQMVFLALGKGRFEPRQVKVGLEAADGWREVAEGLKGGEEIVTSAQFLLDSESRTREAVAKMLKSQQAPAPGQEGAPAKPAVPGPAPPAPHRH
jgi:Cu(I)/Ag(I) efflux system membrane fusion protein/cobalt-zinc-cadmium efflux system membrane fusion protein